MGPLNLEKIRAMLQVNLSYWLQNRGSRAFPKHQVRKIRALMLQDVYVSTTTGEKGSEVSTWPGFLPQLLGNTSTDDHCNH